MEVNRPTLPGEVVVHVVQLVGSLADIGYVAILIDVPNQCEPWLTGGGPTLICVEPTI